jgi:Lysyl oxidase
MRLGVALALAVTAVAAIAGISRTAAPAGELLPDLLQELPESIGVSQEKGRWRLGFASRVSNIGAGPLIVAAQRPDRRTRTMPARQRVRSADGKERVGRLVGRLRYERAETHSHWHLLPFEHYELRAAGGEVSASVALKQGFCLGDRYRIPNAERLNSPTLPPFRHECGKGFPGLLSMREGISVGYGDLYRAYLEGQSFDVTDLPAGEYVLTNDVNRERVIRESSYANNAASVLLGLDWPNGPGAAPRVQVLAECRSSSSCSR